MFIARDGSNKIWQEYQGWPVFLEQPYQTNLLEQGERVALDQETEIMHGNRLEDGRNWLG
jgi:hypothetical protein